MFIKQLFTVLTFLYLLPFPSLLASQSAASISKRPSWLQLFKHHLPETNHEKKERYHLFLKHVSHALKRPEIWNDLQNLLLILMQFEQFANQEVGSRRYEEILAQVIEKRIHFLLSEQQVSELTDILSPTAVDS
ncbi:hypothetical protein [Chlamydia sp.]|uniref:hypothetical protein n=1 Tax=Chlamydia sp. TaxID=35827 RepID=UPI0025BAA255|nr:hypothetical protein [Chlamydia sp.]